MHTTKIELGSNEINFFHKNKFRFFSLVDIFTPDSYLFLQKDLGFLNWEKKNTDFYSQYECLIDPSDQNAFSSLYSASFYYPFKKKLEKILDIKLRNEIRIIAHKLVTNDKIDIHTDYCDPSYGYENFRFIFQFADYNQAIEGGEVCFLGNEDKNNLLKKCPYQPNTGICFEINPFSYHYVTPVRGQRYTLIMYLWKKDSLYDGSGILVK